jgi:hypothetical protein
MKLGHNSATRRLITPGSILRGSIKARLITIVVLSQALLAAGLLFTGGLSDTRKTRVATCILTRP